MPHTGVCSRSQATRNIPTYVVKQFPLQPIAETSDRPAKGPAHTCSALPNRPPKRPKDKGALSETPVPTNPDKQRAAELSVPVARSNISPRRRGSYRALKRRPSFQCRLIEQPLVARHGPRTGQTSTVWPPSKHANCTVPHRDQTARCTTIKRPLSSRRRHKTLMQHLAASPSYLAAARSPRATGTESAPVLCSILHLPRASRRLLPSLQPLP